MVKCPSCGNEVSIDTSVCPECGTAVRDELLERVIPVFRRPKSNIVDPMNSFSRMIRIFIRPADVFINYVNSPDTLGPFLLFLVPILLRSLIYPVFWSHFTLVGADPSGIPAMLFASWVGVFLFEFGMTIFLIIILVTIFHLGARLAGGKGGWRSTWGIMLYALAPIIIARFITLVLIWVIPIPGAGTISITSGLNTIGPLILNSPGWNLSQLIEQIFFIWIGLLVAVGIRENYKLGILQAIIIAAIGTFIYVNLSVIGLSIPASATG